MRKHTPEPSTNNRASLDSPERLPAVNRRAGNGGYVCIRTKTLSPTPFSGQGRHPKN